jgi:DNA primase
VAGTINRDDIASVRERAPIEDIIGQHVSLKSAGVGSLKGLCPFHDERSPSFHVRPQAGRWHCFGCGEGGDVIEFVMRMDGLPFAEAVEYLAERANVTLRYESGSGPRKESAPGMRKRLLEAHRVAAELYSAALASPEAQTGRDFLTERGFDKDTAAHFGIGYAPKGWSTLLDHLRGKGFTEPELLASGLVSQGNNPTGGTVRVYDRFRGRLVWPIRDVTGEVIGFGARKLYEDDQGPKYLNTPETALYKKSQVLYGLDLAKGAIRGERRVVVVEGYTDVMACHLAGVGSAVATCGTAFGEDHVKVVRRLMGDTGGAQLKVGGSAAQVIFTFDGDEAGQNAALKSFALDQQFLAQTFVAVDPDGMDPCDIRQQRGDGAVQALMDARVPLFEFVIKTALGANNLETPEGRVAALRAAAPVVAGIRDRAIQPEYARRLAGWLGMDVEQVRSAVGQAGRAASSQRPSNSQRPASGQHTPGGPPPVADPRTGAIPQVPDAGIGRPNPRDPVVRAEKLVLEVLLQAPKAVADDARAADMYASLEAAAFSVPQYRAVFDGIGAAGGPTGASGSWVSEVAEQVGETLAGVVSELAVSPLPNDKPEELSRYARSVLGRLLDLSLTRKISELRGRMQRIGDGGEGYQETFNEIIALESRRRELREE